MFLWLSITGLLYLARFGIIAIELIGRFEAWGLAERGAHASTIVPGLSFASRVI
jgi:hypothetical protein